MTDLDAIVEVVSLGLVVVTFGIVCFLIVAIL
jgi:hypothetical protein